MARIDEIAPDLYRVSVYVPQLDLQFNHFLIKDDEPLLFHTGMRKMFPEVREAMARLIDLSSLRWISWSHFEVDECGALNEWLAVAPRAQAICGHLGALLNINDYADRPPRALAKDDLIRDRPAQIPVRADAAPAARLGRRGPLRGDVRRAPVLRSVPPDW